VACIIAIDWPLETPEMRTTLVRLTGTLCLRMAVELRMPRQASPPHQLLLPLALVHVPFRAFLTARTPRVSKRMEFWRITG
jgi:hypothetical protein